MKRGENTGFYGRTLPFVSTSKNEKPRGDWASAGLIESERVFLTNCIGGPIGQLNPDPPLHQVTQIARKSWELTLVRKPINPACLNAGFSDQTAPNIQLLIGSIGKTYRFQECPRCR